jgi:hypothetical protein
MVHHWRNIPPVVRFCCHSASGNLPFEYMDGAGACDCDKCKIKVRASKQFLAAAPVDGPAAQAVHAAPVPAVHWPATHAVQSSAESFGVSLERAVRILP